MRLYPIRVPWDHIRQRIIPSRPTPAFPDIFYWLLARKSLCILLVLTPDSGVTTVSAIASHRLIKNSPQDILANQFPDLPVRSSSSHHSLD